jgi:hypothetical protein
MRWLTYLWILPVLFGAVSAPLIGQEDTPPAISADRPGQSAPPGILLPGYIQLEAGVQLGSDATESDGGTTTVRTLSVPGLLVRIGVFTAAELRIATEYRSVTASIAATAVDSVTVPVAETATHGLAGLAVGMKVGITPEHGLVPETAVQLMVGLPAIGNRNFRPPAVAPSILLSMRTTLTDAFSLNYNLGGVWDGVLPDGTGIYTASLGMMLSQRVAGFAELYGSLKTGGVPMHAADAGVSYATSQTMQLDLSGGIGLTDSAPDFFVNAGISYRLPR